MPIKMIGKVCLSKYSFFNFVNGKVLVSFEHI